MAVKNEKVALLMSGGVDSSVAGAILKKSGYKVVGVFGRFLPSSKLRGEKKAKIIANKLGIEFFSFDLVSKFKNKIIDYFIEEQKKGRTPNPCVLCNQEMKFGLLSKTVNNRLKVNYIASGHYAKIKKVDGRYLIAKAKDRSKDQSYFLWRLGQSQLKKIIFPLADLYKKDVKKMAKKLNIPISGRESQEICFVGNALSDFLSKNIGFKKGKILTIEGKKIGEHRGVWFYTIGQRKGINLSSGPWYVVDKNIKSNNLIVSRDKKDLFRGGFKVKETNWQAFSSLPRKFKAMAVVRYNSKQVPVEVSTNKKGEAEVIIKRGKEIITPGQSAVFYKRDNLLGGGIIY